MKGNKKLAHKQTLVRTIDLPKKKKNYFNQRDLTTYDKYMKSPSVQQLMSSITEKCMP
jgi:hypothetical protein